MFIEKAYWGTVSQKKYVKGSESGKKKGNNKLKRLSYFTWGEKRSKSLMSCLGTKASSLNFDLFCKRAVFPIT